MKDKGFSATEFIKKQYKETEEKIHEISLILEKSDTDTKQESQTKIIVQPLTYGEDKMKEKEVITKTSSDEIIKRYLAIAKDFLNSEAFEQAIGIYIGTLKIEPENIEAHEGLIEIYTKFNNATQVINWLSSLASVYEKRGATELANQTYRRILDIDPNNPLARQMLELAGEILPNPEKEIEVTTLSASSKEPIQNLANTQVQNYEPQKDLALSAQEKRETVLEASAFRTPEEALEYYKEIIKKEPFNIEALTKYIDTYLEIGLELELVPQYLTLAEAYSMRGNYEEAKKLYQKVLALEPTNKIASEKLNQLEKNRNITDEISTIRRTLSFNPYDFNSWEKLAKLLEESGNKKEAFAEYRRLADAYMIKALYQKAIAIYENLLKQEPNNKELQNRLKKAKELLISSQTLESAIKSLESGLDYDIKPKIVKSNDNK